MERERVGERGGRDRQKYIEREIHSMRRRARERRVREREREKEREGEKREL